MLHYLRIAVTALSLTACIVIIPLWLRSYRVRDSVEGNIFRFMNVSLFSSEGALTVAQRQVWHSQNVKPWQVHHEPVNEWVRRWTIDAEPYKCKYGFGITGGPDIALTAPHWFLVLLAVLLAAALNLRWRFSLRTLLIATTLVAVALAAIVYASR